MIFRTVFLFLACLGFAAGATLNVPSQYGTINGALAVAQPGDTISVAAGTYSETVSTVRGGTSGAARIIIDGQNVATVNRFYINHPYVTVKNLTVQNLVETTAATCITINRGAHFLRLENVIVDPLYAWLVAGIKWTGGSTRPFSTDAASDCVITGCTVRKVKRTFMIEMFGDRNLVENCTFEDGERIDFVHLWGRDNVFRGCTFDNNFDDSINDPRTPLNHPDFIQTFGNNGHGCWGNIIENCVISNIEAGQMAQLTGDLVPEIGNLTFRNCLFMNIAFQHSCSIPQVKHYNNVYYRCNYGNGGHAVGFGKRPHTVNGVTDFNYSNGSEVKNCVFVDCGDTRITTGWYSFDPVLTGVSADYNLVIKNGAAVDEDPANGVVGGGNLSRDTMEWYEENGINGQDPLFLDIANGDARFAPTSPLKDAGVTLAAVPTDANGTARPLGAAYDIGRFESGGTAPVGSAPVVSISAPTNGASFQAGVSQTWTATATDAEDGTISASVVWSSSITGQFGAGASFSASLPSAGSHTITATVIDSDNRVGTASISVTVSAPASNLAPAVAITAPVGTQNIDYIDYITFTGTAVDDLDGDIASSLIWTSSLSGVIGQGPSFEVNKLALGSHTITASATDSGGLSGAASVIVAVSAGSTFFGELVPLEWDANIVGDNVLFYRLYERHGTVGEYSYTMREQSIQPSADVRAATGEHIFVVTAVNSAGESDFSTPLTVNVVNQNRQRNRKPRGSQSLIP